MSVLIAPSILSADFSNLGASVRAIEAGGCDWVHLDVMDGSFVPPITFGAQMASALRRVTSLPLDCHLMIHHPETQIESFREAGVDRLTVHVEACEHLHRVLQEIRDSGMSCGVALNPATPVVMLEPVISLVDLVLVMTVNPGWGGQTFLYECLEKIRLVRSLSDSVYVEVDGGIDEETGRLAVEAGANVLVAGSYTFSGDPVDRVQSLREAVCGRSVLE